MALAFREETFRDPALTEHLDRAGVPTTGARAVEVLVGAPFDDDDIDAGQRQLGGEHQPLGPPPAITTARSLERTATIPHLQVLRALREVREERASFSARSGRLRQAPLVAVCFPWRNAAYKRCRHRAGTGARA
jgi:hypothetical protein